MRSIFLFFIVFILFVTLQAQNEIELTEIKPFHYVYMEFEFKVQAFPAVL